MAVLRKRGLVTVNYDQVYVPPFGMVDRLRVRLTTARPAGLMSRWSLIALARLYEA
ncbi:hypothetical protein [Saccharopolyspora sp. 5N708]|uniref:hypothetical protein n=1 Tax=Saccharopolyspora sp. 5N708 TaxID=3457424 RepID=UPI003FD36098